MRLHEVEALDAVDRGLLLGELRRRREECPKCGAPRSMCSDPETVWYPQRRVCRSAMETAAAQRLYDQIHSEETGRVFHDGTFTEWAPRASPFTPFRYDDGVSIHSTPVDLAPTDQFLTPVEVVEPTPETEPDADPDGGSR